MRSSEQVKLIGKLASSEQTSTAEKRSRILSHAPHWKKYELAGALPVGSSVKLMALHNQSLLVRSQLLSSDKQLRQLVLNCLGITPDLEPAQYILTMIYELVRDDAGQYQGFVETTKGVAIFGKFMQFLERPRVDSYLSDKLLFFLSGLICHSNEGAFTSEEISELVDKLFTVPENKRSQTNNSQEDSSIYSSSTQSLNGGYCSVIGALDVLGNLVKVDSYRMQVLSHPKVVEFISANLAPGSPTSHIYKASVIIWLLSFNEEIIPILVSKDLIRQIASTIIDCRSEKVVRVTLNLLKNVMNNDAAVESIIDLGLLQYLTILEYEKWLDPDIYEEIRQGQILIDQKLKQFSNFDRYCIELDKKKFKWSFLHTEKFWLENVMNFEAEEFAAVKKLAHLLKTSDDPTTLAVACFDIGEFARLYPMGKQVLSKLNVKEVLMTLMTSPNREISKEALLSIQKLMLNKWNRANVAVNSNATAVKS
ncbi:putative vacuolar ATP synthase subunit 54kD [Cryptosporidium felis]|nr:putative vacuolar ATP synthase subunit 54kD [Cryptosporidium felis]